MADATRIHNKDQSVLGMTLTPDENDIRHLTATIPGPVSTPYDGGIFSIDINLPEPNDPQDTVVAKQYINDNATFVATARRWTEDFAKSSSTGFNVKVQKLVEMGFPEALVKKNTGSCRWR